MITPEEHQRRMDEKIEAEFDILDMDDEKEEEKGKGDDGSNGSNGGDGGDETGKESSISNVETSLEQMNLEQDKKNDENEADNEKEDEMKPKDEDDGGDDDDDEYADMEEFEDDNVMEDEAMAPNASSTIESTTKATSNTSSDNNNNIMKVRTYDLSITYDKYYQTPRVWMMGYESSDSSQPLTGEQMLQDVMSDYANRTVTIDPHPHVTGYHASIHPCQHGAVMKTIVKNLTKAAGGTTAAGGESNDDSGGTGEAQGPSVEMYLFIFLKFVSSIIPTINYDFTMDVTASTEK